MKRIAIAAAVLAATALGSIGAASAVEFDVGPGGVYVGPRHHWRGDYAYRDDGYAYAGRCRVIERDHINRFGEHITVRRRICD
jgi:hypothetical protein